MEKVGCGGAPRCCWPLPAALPSPSWSGRAAARAPGRVRQVWAAQPLNIACVAGTCAVEFDMDGVTVVVQRNVDPAQRIGHQPDVRVGRVGGVAQRLRSGRSSPAANPRGACRASACCVASAVRRRPADAAGSMPGDWRSPADRRNPCVHRSPGDRQRRSRVQRQRRRRPAPRPAVLEAWRTRERDGGMRNHGRALRRVRRCEHPNGERCRGQWLDCRRSGIVAPVGAWTDTVGAEAMVRTGAAAAGSTVDGCGWAGRPRQVELHCLPRMRQARRLVSLQGPPRRHACRLIATRAERE